MYRIALAAGVEGDLRRLPRRLRGPLLDAIEEHLSRQPTAETRNRKILESLVPPFDAHPPVWELRVREIRVYYDVDEAERLVLVRAIRRKPPHRTTEDIL